VAKPAWAVESQGYRRLPPADSIASWAVPRNVMRAAVEESVLKPSTPQAIAPQVASNQASSQPPPPQILPSPPDPVPPEQPSLTPAEVIPVPKPQNPVTPKGQLLPDERPICELTTGILASGNSFPENVAATHFQADMAAWMPRPWEGSIYFWDAPDYCHRPLYYEEVNLERYGYSHAPLIQPALSGAHFFCATLALPYNSTVHPPHECIYPLGHYRPGSPVPYRIHWPEWDAKAAAVQAGAVGGLILLIP